MNGEEAREWPCGIPELWKLLLRAGAFYDSVNKPRGQHDARWDALESVFFPFTHT